MCNRKASLPSKIEIQELAHKIAAFEAESSGQPFSMEKYFHWLTRTSLFKDVKGGGDHDTILLFGPFGADRISVHLKKDHLKVDMADILIPFKTLEGAKKATIEVIDLLFMPRDPLYKRAKDLFIATAKGSGVVFCIQDDQFSYASGHIGYIKVRISHDVYISSRFNDATPDKVFEHMARYAVRYKTVYDKYKKYHCKAHL